MILIIDDEEKLRGLLSRIIGLEGFEVVEAGTCKSGLKKIETYHIDVVLCDVKLPDGNGVDLVKEIKAQHPAIEIILMTAYGNIADGVQAIKNGAFDYITKGDDNNKIIPLLNRAIEKVNLSKRINQLEKQVEQKYSFENILGKSKPILAAVDLAKKVAATDTTVLLLGETGTGKEVFAQSIHQASLRKNKPFVAINCSAFSKELLESEMFGHVAGAFTGAAKDKKGLFEEANTGTIFLDEVGEMSLDLQAKLLRILESGELIKVGESKPKKINVRIIAATNRDLKSEIEKGTFRSDLFYRLSVFQIILPSLRERIADIEILAKHFSSIFAAKTNKQVYTISAEFIEALKNQEWNGNIRELKNVIERSVILTEGNELTIDTLPLDFKKNIDSAKQLSAFDLSSVEKLHIQKVLNYTNGNKTETAKLLNIGLTTLYRKIEEYKIS
ncbi:MAG TPA: sigma-54 dependent transcriptional regulator [Chitinophagales bacterium]|jgi:two-component system NtrC family response regulator|nr:sigma-54 dependent transcriptional regulator [Chitinophagales bacterium]